MADIVYLDNISKSYPKLNTNRYRLSAFKSAILNQPYKHQHQIIKPLSLTIKKGQSLGLIGENGAGKSTFLKLVSGVLNPTTGKIKINCTVSALLELGAGFHPDYNGLDNILMNAALSGLSKRELSKKIDDIVNFADIGFYIDEPTKHYSSGMVVRLGFAIMTAMSPDLLITDEVLAVGDESFQKKCIDWMENYLSEGGTLLLCSHGMFHIQKLCHQALWLENGLVRELGDAYEVTQNYLAYHAAKSSTQEELKIKYTSGAYYVKEAFICDDNDNIIHSIHYRDDLLIQGVIYSPDDREPVVAIGINKNDGTPIYGTSSEITKGRLIRVQKNHYKFSICFPNINLLPGHFVIKVHAMDPEGMRLFDEYCLELQVKGKTLELGSVSLEHQWKE